MVTTGACATVFFSSATTSISYLPASITLAISAFNHSTVSLPLLKSARIVGIPLIRQAAIAPIVPEQR